MKKMYCAYCGKELKDSVNFCSYCGKEIKESSVKKEKASIGWGILGFFFPLVGLILFLVWLKDRPLASKYAGIGALIKFLLYIYLTVILIIFVIFEVILGVDKAINRNTKDDFPRRQEVYGEDDWS